MINDSKSLTLITGMSSNSTHCVISSATHSRQYPSTAEVTAACLYLYSAPSLTPHLSLPAPWAFTEITSSTTEGVMPIDVPHTSSYAVHTAFYLSAMAGSNNSQHYCVLPSQSPPLLLLGLAALPRPAVHNTRWVQRRKIHPKLHHM